MSNWPDPYVQHGYPQTYVYLPPVHRSSTAHLVFAWLAAVLTTGYMLPWAIGATRNRTNCVGTALVNFFLGWTIIGWIVALVMACGSEPQQPVVVRTIPAPYVPPVYPPYPPAPGYGSAMTPTRPAALPRQPSAAEVTMPLPTYPDRPWQGDRGDLR